MTRSGSHAARDRLVARYSKILQRWAHGRLPASARDLAATEDIVQVTLMKALAKLKSFEPRREGAFMSYLRAILMNSVRDEIRRTRRIPWHDEIPDHLEHDSPSPLQQVLTAETLDKYETALQSLPEKTREAVILRVEFGFTFPQIAEAIESRSSNAVRMLVTRALVDVARAMSDVAPDD